MKNLLLSVFAAASLTPAANAETLADYRQAYRPLLIFAPDFDSSDYQFQSDALQAHLSAMRKRDMAVIAVNGDKEPPEMMLGPRAPRLSSAALRDTYGLGAVGIHRELITAAAR